MKTLFTLPFLLFIFYAAAQKDSYKINKIRQAVHQINKDSGYSIRKLSEEDFLEEVPDNGGELTGYFKNGQLVKMIEWIGLSSCVNITEYYLQNGKLIFAYTNGSESPYIDSLQEFDHSKLNKAMECRFYFDNDKVLKKSIAGSTRCSGTPDDDLPKYYLDACSRYRTLLMKSK